MIDSSLAHAAEEIYDLIPNEFPVQLEADLEYFRHLDRDGKQALKILETYYIKRETLRKESERRGESTGQISVAPLVLTATLHLREIAISQYTLKAEQATKQEIAHTLISGNCWQKEAYKEHLTVLLSAHLDKETTTAILAEIAHTTNTGDHYKTIIKALERVESNQQ